MAVELTPEQLTTANPFDFMSEAGKQAFAALQAPDVQARDQEARARAKPLIDKLVRRHLGFLDKATSGT